MKQSNNEAIESEITMKQSNNEAIGQEITMKPFKHSAIKLLFLTTILGFTLIAPNANESLFVIPKNWEKPHYNFSKNPLTKENVALGKKLFYDPILSSDSTISCASCHLSFTAFTHIDHEVSHGIRNQKGNRNSSTLFNLAWQKSFMWDGRITHLDVQALAPISDSLEMGNTMHNVVSSLSQSTNYKADFKTVYGDDNITEKRVLKSISQFLLTIQSYNSKYDKFIRQEDGVILTQSELNGLVLFREHCVSCHTEPLFTNNDFRNNGLLMDGYYKDYGRILVTQNPQDSFRFKVPSLRNVELSFPYMHDGRFKKLEQVMEHYGNLKNSTLNHDVDNEIQLSAVDKQDLIAFLKTLTDRTFLMDKRYQQ